MNSKTFTKKTIEELNRFSISEIKEVARFPVWLVLDDVRSMHNVGLGFPDGRCIQRRRHFPLRLYPQPPHRDIHKTALGATETVPWKYATQVTDALENLKSEGYTIWAVEQAHNSIALQEISFDPTDKIALVFGNEVSGVSDEALALCDGCVEIPQWGTKHSLNISVTVGIALWEIVKKL